MLAALSGMFGGDGNSVAPSSGDIKGAYTFGDNENNGAGVSFGAASSQSNFLMIGAVLVVGYLVLKGRR